MKTSLTFESPLIEGETQTFSFDSDNPEYPLTVAFFEPGDAADLDECDYEMSYDFPLDEVADIHEFLGLILASKRS